MRGMTIENRMITVLIALAYCVWASATLVRHFAATPDATLRWLFQSPAVACLIVAVGLEIERRANQVRGWVESPDWRRVPGLAIGLQYGGMLLLAWRGLWMFFSWDGMFFFPAWCAVALALLRWRPRWLPCA